MTVWIASDHAGVQLKSELIKSLPQFEWGDLGPMTTDSVDYPDYANLVAEKINARPSCFGILICGSGQGMAMRANKYPQVRAALVWNEEIARLSRGHNNANILCLGARMTSLVQAKKWTEIFLTTPFEEGRHRQRVTKINC